MASPNQYQLNQNKIFGAGFEFFANRAAVVLIDIFKMLIEFIRSMISMVIGK